MSTFKLVDDKPISEKDKTLMGEAVRRFYMFHTDMKDIKAVDLGLGIVSEYKKSKYFTCEDITPRVKNWWRLTDDGALLFMELINTNKDVITKAMKKGIQHYSIKGLVFPSPSTPQKTAKDIKSELAELEKEIHNVYASYSEGALEEEIRDRQNILLSCGDKEIETYHKKSIEILSSMKSSLYDLRGGRNVD